MLPVSGGHEEDAGHEEDGFKLELETNLREISSFTITERAAKNLCKLTVPND